METIQELDIESIKEDFPILKKIINNHPLVYLDNANSTQKPKQVLDAMENFYRNNYANVHRAIYTLSNESTIAYENSRKKVANFINAKPSEIIFTKGTTESLNLLAYSLTKELKENDEVIVSEAEHHSNFVPWQQISKEKKLQFKVLPLKDGIVDIENLMESISDKTKIISLIHMSNVLGTINNMEEIAKLCNEKNIIFIVDAAQSISRLKIDVKKINCDFLVFSGHKMYGPTGIGVLYGKREHLEKLSPFNYGGDMIKQVTKKDTIFNDLPWKFEAGTPNIVGAIGLASAIDYMENIGIENIKKHEEELTKLAYDHLSKVDGVKIHSNKESLSIISFSFYDLHPHDISAVLDQKAIAIRSGHHCSMPLMESLGITACNRVSFSIYNTQEDVHRLINGLGLVKELFKK